jgi:hypothetical protein
MRSYQIAVTIVGLIIAVTVAVGFSIIGNPVSQQTVRYDETRYNDFQQIKVQVENYYSSNGALPQSLKDLNYANINLEDPLTKKPYDYKILDTAQYQLCTDFSTDADTFRKSAANNYWDIPIKHMKGYSCVPLTVPAYIQTQPKPMR